MTTLDYPAKPHTPATTATTAISDLLSHDTTFGPDHLHYYGPPSPGVRDDYFELSESNLVRKLNDLRDKNRFTLKKVPSLLGPPVSREPSLPDNVLLDDEGSGGEGDDLTDPTYGSPSVTRFEPGHEDSVGGGSEKEQEPTDTDWEAAGEAMEAEEEEAMLRHAERKRRLVRLKRTKGVVTSFSEVSPSNSPRHLPPLRRRPSPSPPPTSSRRRKRSEQMDVIRNLIDRIPSPAVERMNDADNTTPKGKNSKKKELLPWEGKEISIPSSCSSRSGSSNGASKRDNTTTLPPYPNVLQSASSSDVVPLKLAFNASASSTSSSEDDNFNVESDAKGRPTMEERYKNLLNNPSVGSGSCDATSATASLSVSCGGRSGSEGNITATSSSSQQESRKLVVKDGGGDDDGLVRRMKVGDGENEWNGMAEVDEESSRSRTSNNSNSNGSSSGEEEEDISGYLNDLILSPPLMRRVTEEEIEEYDAEEEGSYGLVKRPSSAPIISAPPAPPPPPPRTLDTLDLVCSSSASGELGEEERGRICQIQEEEGDGKVLLTGFGSPDYRGLDLIRETTDTATTMENGVGVAGVDVMETDESSTISGLASPKSLGSSGVVGIGKRMFRRVNRMKSGRKTLSSAGSSSTASTTRWANTGRNDVGGVTSPLSFQSSLDRTKSEYSIDSTATPSQWHWQEQSMSSLSASISTPSRGDMSSIISTTSSKKKKKKEKKRKGWKIGKRSKADDGKLRDRPVTSPTTLMEEEEEWKEDQEEQQQQQQQYRNSQLLRPQEQPECARESPGDDFMIISNPTDITDRTDTTDDTSMYKTHQQRKHPHHQYRRKHDIKMNEQARLSKELFMTLADEVDFDEFIKRNRISFAGDFLLGKMLRERTRLQCKVDMLDSDLEMYVDLHGRSRQRSTTAATASSSLSEAAEVYGDSHGVGGVGKSDNSTITDDRSVLFAI